MEGRRFREMAMFFSGTDLVNDFSEAEYVCARSARPLGWNEPLGADIRLIVPCLGDQPDVNQLGNTLREDDIGGFYVAMNKACPVEMSQRVCDGESQI